MVPTNQIQFFVNWFFSLFRKKQYVVYITCQSGNYAYLCEVKPGEYAFKEIPVDMAARFYKKHAKQAIEQITQTGEYEPCDYMEYLNV